MKTDKQKIRIHEYGFRVDGCISAYSNRGILTLVPCNVTRRRGTAKLFCDRMGRFYTLSCKGLRQVFGNECKCSVENRKTGSMWKYKYMRDFQNKACHILICTAFHGPRPDGYQCDHINGVHTDNRAENLQWVTPEENRRRARILKAMRKRGLRPEDYSPTQLLHYFENDVLFLD